MLNQGSYRDGYPEPIADPDLQMSLKDLFKSLAQDSGKERVILCDPGVMLI